MSNHNLYLAATLRDLTVLYQFDSIDYSIVKQAWDEYANQNNFSLYLHGTQEEDATSRERIAAREDYLQRAAFHNACIRSITSRDASLDDPVGIIHIIAPEDILDENRKKENPLDIRAYIKSISLYKVTPRWKLYVWSCYSMQGKGHAEKLAGIPDLMWEAIPKEARTEINRSFTAEDLPPLPEPCQEYSDYDRFRQLFDVQNSSYMYTYYLPNALQSRSLDALIRLQGDLSLRLFHSLNSIKKHELPGKVVMKAIYAGLEYELVMDEFLHQADAPVILQVLTASHSDPEAILNTMLEYSCHASLLHLQWHRFAQPDVPITLVRDMELVEKCLQFVSEPKRNLILKLMKTRLTIE